MHHEAGVSRNQHPSQASFANTIKGPAVRDRMPAPSELDGQERSGRTSGWNQFKESYDKTRLVARFLCLHSLLPTFLVRSHASSPCHGNLVWGLYSFDMFCPWKTVSRHGRLREGESWQHLQLNFPRPHRSRRKSPLQSCSASIELCPPQTGRRKLGCLGRGRQQGKSRPLS